MPALSLSTCWNSARHSDGYAMVGEILDLGFDRIELSHGTRLTLVAGILRAVEEGLVTISSVHNFCPLPPGILSAAPNLHQPSDPSRSELQQWYRYTCKTIEFAGQVGAPVMVTHLGSVLFSLVNPVARTERRLRRGSLPAGDPHRMQAIWSHALAKVARRAPAYWDRVRENLVPLNAFAARHGIVIACENRERLDELPLDAAIPELFTGQEETSQLRYWHDAGHAQLKQEAGVANHQALLETNQANLAGFHLHDVCDGRDHSVPGTGTVDFEMIGGFMRPDHICVLELSPRLSTEEVLESKRFLEAVLGI